VNTAVCCNFIFQDSPLAEGLIGAVVGAVVGSVITGAFILWQTRRLLKEERDRRKEDEERELKSIVLALLWEIDDFYKLSIRDVCRKLKDTSPSDLGFYVKSPTYKSFTVFEATANKIGLAAPALVQGIVGYYGMARAYLTTTGDYGDALQYYLESGMQSQFRKRAITLLEQIQKSSIEMVPLTRTVCALLAERAETAYTFEAP
jgi:hypothetical protein